MSWPLGAAINARTIPGTGERHWRSAAPDRLDDAGWAELRARGITTVVDLRNDDELPPASSRPMAVAVVRAPLEDPQDPQYAELWAGDWARPDFYGWGIGQWPSLWRAAFEGIAAAPGGILVHCAAGRDRTGALVAVLLERAGVAREIVLDDYELAVRGTSRMRALRSEEADIPPERLDGVIARYRALLADTLDALPEALERSGLTDAADRAARRLIV